MADCLTAAGLYWKSSLVRSTALGLAAPMGLEAAARAARHPAGVQVSVAARPDVDKTVGEEYSLLLRTY